MSDILPLSGPSVAPAAGGAPKQLVIFLHGIGADGNDLIGLAPHFQQALPDARFISPNAPFPFDMAPYGYQWFGLQDFTDEARLRGAERAAPALDAFIDAELARDGLSDEDLALIGFSQGAMMSLHVGLRRARAMAGIVSYSGMLVGLDALRAERRSSPPVLLTHGTEDPVLPFAFLAEAETGLKSLGLTVEAHPRPGLPHGIDGECVRLGQDFLARAFAKAG
ncbi:MAG: dienelactone hydrolase family protein [Rhodospirillales bacterium]|jgi:phospholipase/carboxylesterase|nr:dienelactone hydrolase family protein [Rhodospirillales bacterium]